MNHDHHARAMLVISMAVFGTLGPFVRCIPLSSSALALARAVLAAALIFLYLTVSRQNIPLKQMKGEAPLLLLSGAAMGINWILLFESYKYTAVSIATLSYYFAPVIVTIACPILFRERLTGKQILCFLMSTAGLVLITGLGKGGQGGRDLIGILFGLGAAAFYAAVILLNKFIRQVNGIHRTFLQFLAAIAVLIPYVAASGGMGLDQMNAVSWAALLTVGFVHTGITYCLYFSSLKELPGQKAAILSYIDPLVAVFVSICFLGEKITPPQLLGGAMILGFTLLNELPSRHPEAADSHVSV
ncbi:MAG TPA: DMT family transporter [Candidatus Enterocloster faecavium]|uniref:DMT family transporter n=1 Tax=Candidatus Enterocloster faecavium TaxID=2838560 RepID=A0A9D2L8T4_9FIRM|nr:DMT family transporter [Candidatus Enterocloster faecavium]